MTDAPIGTGRVTEPAAALDGPAIELTALTDGGQRAADVRRPFADVLAADLGGGLRLRITTRKHGTSGQCDDRPKQRT